MRQLQEGLRELVPLALYPVAEVALGISLAWAVHFNLWALWGVAMRADWVAVTLTGVALGGIAHFFTEVLAMFSGSGASSTTKPRRPSGPNWNGSPEPPVLRPKRRLHGAGPVLAFGPPSLGAPGPDLEPSQQPDRAGRWTHLSPSSPGLPSGERSCHPLRCALQRRGLARDEVLALLHPPPALGRLGRSSAHLGKDGYQQQRGKRGR